MHLRSLLSLSLLACSLPTLAAAQEPAPAPAPIEVKVRGARSEAQRLQRSAEAVSVVDTRRAKQQGADLGEVLARVQGINIRRDGGLGSTARFSLNGLQNEQIRFFLDGIPLDVAGYPFGVANVPVNLIERVEVYRGVVPIRFGADALGGALNLVTDARYETHLSASYQISSFGTHRATVNGRYRHDATGWVVGASAFADKSDNDYRVDVLAPNASGQLEPANVRRFHDGYRAFGGALEAGIVERPWAKRLLIRAYATTYDKELQHNIVMAFPYGQVTNGETLYGASARYDVDLRRAWKLESVASYGHRTIDYVDNAPWTYDWFGRRTPRRARGEVSSRPIDQTTWQQTGFARAVLSWEVAPRHFLRASVTPTLVTRSGESRELPPTMRDPLSAERQLFTFVSGLEYELNLFADRLANIVFVKDYVYRSQSEEALPGNLFVRADRNSHDNGIGDSLRVRILPWLYVKASYEYATRLPGPDEVYGNGAFIGPSLYLRPEVSHNGNVGPHLELRQPGLGQLSADINAFVRQSDDLIVLFGRGNDDFSYRNLFKARGLGLENAAAWTSPGRWVTLDGSLTWQDIRNQSTRGEYAASKGKRVPNRPWLFASWGARLRFTNLPGVEDTLEPYYIGRWVHSFYRDFVHGPLFFVPAQVTHNIGLTYVFARDLVRSSATFEISNLSDAKVFDNFGVQKPGRAFHFKLTAEL
jgi:vitamin B12 transporter